MSAGAAVHAAVCPCELVRDRGRRGGREEACSSSLEVAESSPRARSGSMVHPPVTTRERSMCLRGVRHGGFFAHTEVCLPPSPPLCSAPCSAVCDEVGSAVCDEACVEVRWTPVRGVCIRVRIRRALVACSAAACPAVAASGCSGCISCGCCHQKPCCAFCFS